MISREMIFQRAFCVWLSSHGFKWIRVKADGASNKGKPDIAVFWMGGWAWLEFKRSRKAPYRPGQRENIAWASKAGMGAFVFPENEQLIKNMLLKRKSEDEANH